MSFILYFVLGLLPIIWLVIALCGLKWPGYKAAFVAMVIAALESVTIFQTSAKDTVTSALEGFAFAFWPIVIVIIAAVFTYNLVLKMGSMETIKQLITSITADKRLLTILIGWCFGGFMEGMAGFGTAVAIPASMLVALGLNPITSCLVCLVANGTPTPFGSIGIPTVTLANTTGLTGNLLAFASTLGLGILIVLSPFVIVCSIGKGLKALKGIFHIVLAAGLSFWFPEVLIAYFAGPELSVITGSVVSLFVTVLLCLNHSKNHKIPEEYKVEIKNSETTIPWKKSLFACSPFILIFVILLCTSRLVTPVYEFLIQFSSKIKISTSPNASDLTFAWIETPGVMIMIAAIIGGRIQKCSFYTMFHVLIETIKQMAKTVLVLLFILATAKIMQYSGMISAIASLFATFGVFYPLGAPVIGALGTFVTGSGTSSSALFATVQMQAAESIGANSYWIVAANSLGVAAGKIFSPQNIATGLVAVKQSGKDGEVLKKALPYGILFLCISCLICFFGQYVWAMFGIG